MSKWEVYQGSRQWKYDFPAVSILRAGVGSLSRLAIRLLKSDYVELLWDSEKLRIGLKPVSQEVLHAYKIARNPRGGAYLSMTGFLHAYGIAHKEKKTYRLEDCKDGIFIIDLNKSLE